MKDPEDSLSPCIGCNLLKKRLQQGRGGRRPSCVSSVNPKRYWEALGEAQSLPLCGLLSFLHELSLKRIR